MLLRIVIGVICGEILLFGALSLGNDFRMREAVEWFLGVHAVLIVLATIWFCVWGIGFAFTGDPSWGAE